MAGIGTIGKGKTSVVKDQFPVLTEVKDILTKRQNVGGASEDSFPLIANYWNTYLTQLLGIPVNISNKDVTMLMSLMKVAREQIMPKHDNLADIIGYTAHTDRIATEQAEYDKAWREAEATMTEGEDKFGGMELTGAAMDEWLDTLAVAKFLSGFTDNDGGKSGAPAMIALDDLRIHYPDLGITPVDPYRLILRFPH